MTTIVTGGLGFVGSHLTRALLAQGHRVRVIDDASGGYSENLADIANEPGFDLVEMDVRDADGLARVIDNSTEQVYHLTSIVGVRAYCEDPLGVLDTNYLGTRNVVELCVERGARLLFTSTSEVFGRNPEVPWNEDSDRVLGSTTVDRWCYSSSKALCEHLIFGLTKRGKLKATVVRFFNAYGPHQKPIFVVSQSVHRVLNGKQPDLYDGGAQTRCFTYIGDIIEGVLLAATSERTLGEALNLGSNRESTMKEAIEAVLDQAGVRDKLTWRDFDTQEHYGDRYEDIGRRVPSVQKAKNLLGWEASTDLSTGVAATIQWARQNPWWLDLQP